VAQKQSGRFRQGPREVGVADLLARGASACAGGCFRTLDEATRRHAILHPGATSNRVEVVQAHEAEDCAHTGHRLSQGEGMGSVWLGGFDAGELQGAEELIVRGEQGQVDLDVLVDRRSGKAFGDALTMGLGGDLLANLGQVVWAVGMLDMGQKCSPFAPEVGAAPQAGTGGTQLSRRDGGLREQAAAQEGGKLLGIDLSMLGLAAMEGLHGEGVAQDKGKPLFSTPVGEPVPGEEALDGDHETITRGRNGLEERCRRGFHSAVQEETGGLIRLR
jgi:hypothetical protein